jgi:hypothetical protein
LDCVWPNRIQRCRCCASHCLADGIEGSYDAPTADSSVGIVPVHVIKRFVKSTHRVDVALHACRLLRRLQSFILAHRDMVMATPSLLSAVATVLQPLMKLLHYITVRKSCQDESTACELLSLSLFACRLLELLNLPGRLWTSWQL